MQRCAGCHGPGKMQGGFSAVLDVGMLISQRKIVPGDSQKSKLFTLVSAGTMPRGGPKATSAEVDQLRQWIDCGAPDFAAQASGKARLSFVGIDERLVTIYEDLRGIDNPVDRKRMRYLDLTTLSNAGMGDGDIDAYRQTVSFLVNSLSQGNRVVSSGAVDKQQLLYRIDLRDYGWSAATWDSIVADYPYAVRYNPDSRIFPYDEDMAQSIREDTDTEIPYIAGDWFLAHASLAPLYYDILQIPTDIRQLARGLGIDIDREVRDGQVSRAGFNRSGVSVNNRVIERHDQPGNGGAFWLSYDFASSDGDRNIFAHPTDFRQDAGEGFFNLPNGLQAYFIQDGRFQRIDKADPKVVTDPNSKDRAVSPGLSCLGGCHLSKGILPKDDEVRAHVQASGADAATREATFALYPDVKTMRALIDQDMQRYGDALADTGFMQMDDNTLNIQVRKHQDLVTVEDLAALLGIAQDTLTDALAASPQAFPPEIAALREKGGAVYRDTIDALFGQIVIGVGLGEPLSVRSRSSVTRSSTTGSSASSSSSGSSPTTRSSSGSTSTSTPSSSSSTSTSSTRHR